MRMLPESDKVQGLGKLALGAFLPATAPIGQMMHMSVAFRRPVDESDLTLPLMPVQIGVLSFFCVLVWRHRAQQDVQPAAAFNDT